VSETALDSVLTRPGPLPSRSVSPFEFLPGWLCYGPVVAQWVALGLFNRDFTLPTAANPAITTGGLCGESKSAILDLVAGPARHWLAPYATILTAPADRAGTADPAAAQAAMAATGLGFPLVVKPDIGCNGTGVRLVTQASALPATLAAYPRGVRLVLQHYVPFEGEAGLFYIREPDAPAGRITSLTLKHPPVVTGDGVRTLRQLIAEDPRHGRLQHLYHARLAGELGRVPAKGERVRLVFTGNHCKGSIFRNGNGEITAAMTARIDAIARAMPDFHFGRIDVRYESLGALRRGEGFRIIEINGVGSEATHIWDPDTSLFEVWRAQLFHYGAAWRIGRTLRARGARPSGLRTLLRDWRNQRRLLASYPLND
jgi:hypothetical protein